MTYTLRIKNGDITLSITNRQMHFQSRTTDSCKKIENAINSYARAMEKILKKSVKDKYLYLFSPQSVVKLD